MFCCLFVFAAAQPVNEATRFYGNPGSDPAPEAPQKIIRVSDGNYVIAGTWRDSAFLMKINTAGDTLWTRRYAFGATASFNSVTEITGGAFVAAGYYKNAAGCDGSSRILVVKTAGDGLVQQQFVYGYAGKDAEARSIVTTSAGEVAITGLVNNPNGSNENAFFIKLNTSLAVLAVKEINTGLYERGNSIVQLADGSFAIAGLLRTATNTSYAWLAKLSATGDTVWTRRSSYPSSELYVIKQLAAGTLVAGGYRKVDTTKKNDAYLLLADPANGNITRQEIYGSTGNDELRDLAVVDGGLLAGGVYGLPSSANWGPRAWIFKLDASYAITQNTYWDSYLFASLFKSFALASADGHDYSLVVHRAFFSFSDIHYVHRSRNGHKAVVTVMPVNFQLYARGANDSATVNIQGTAYNNIGTTYSQMRLYVYRNSTQLVANLTRNLSFSGNTAAFSFTVPIRSELAEYDFRLFGYNATLGEKPEAEALGIVAGDVHIVQGQSNGVADLGADSTFSSAYNRYVRNFGLKQTGDTNTYIWRREAYDDNIYQDRVSGVWALVIAEKLARTYNRPIAILNGSVSGIPIDSMLSGAYNQSYRKFLKRVQLSGLINNIRSLMFFQGESDAIVFNTETVGSYKAKFNTLNTSWNADFPSIQRRYLFQIRPGALAVGGIYEAAKTVQEAQRQLAMDLPATRIMSSSGMNHDGIHYFYTNGYKRAGDDMYRLVATDMYGDNAVQDIYAPDIDTAFFSNPARTELTVSFKNNPQNLAGFAGYQKDFFAEGDTANCKITGYQVVNNKLVLQLSAAPGSNFTGISYTSHIGIGNPAEIEFNSGSPVKNANGTGMLCFYNRPVGPYVPGMVQKQKQTKDLAIRR